jgi:hypothetical protein
MDKHNKHHKNKAKGTTKPQSSQPSTSILEEPIVHKTEDTIVLGRKPKSPTGKRK